MAFIGVLPEVPTFAQNFSRSITEGLSRGASRGFDTAQKLMLQQGKGRKPLGLKGFSDAYKNIEKFKANTFRDEDKSEIARQYTRFMSENPDVNEEDALEYVIDQYSRLPEEKKARINDRSLTPFQKSRKDVEQGHPLGALGEYLQPGYETSKKHPLQLAKELPVAATKSLESLAALQDPTQLITSLLTGKTPLQASDVLFPYLRKDLSEEEKEGAERIAGAESFLLDWLGPMAASKLMKLAKGSKGLGALAEVSPEIQAAQKATAGEEVIKDIGNVIPELEASETGSALKGKVSEGKPSAATELRIERLDPSSKIYKPKEQAALREFQVKLVPQYESEIAADEAVRLARAEAREPKTAVGIAGISNRMEAAEARLPEIQKGYQKAIARVRALEDEVASLKGVQREQAEKILEAATKELNNAEFELHQTMENLKGGSARAGIEAMEKAAQTKLQKISEMVGSGEEVVLAKMDYSPELIKQAKAIAKGRKLKANKIDDFYTQVHDTYANQYRQRLAQLDKEMEAAMQQRNMSGLHQRQLIGKERDAVKKLIESAEAENTIHRHKLALREMQQRKIAAERFKKLKPSEGKEKVKEVFGQKAWKQKIEEAKTPEARERVIKKGVAQVAAENPSKADAIEKEGGSLADTIGKIKKESESAPTTAQEAKNKSSRVLKDFAEMKDKFPNIWSTRMGKDLLLGAGSAVWDDVRKDLDLDVTASMIIPLIGGGGVRGGAYRFAFNRLTKIFLKNLHVNKAVDAYEKSDMKKFKEYTPSVQKKAKEKIRGF